MNNFTKRNTDHFSDSEVLDKGPKDLVNTSCLSFLKRNGNCGVGGGTADFLDNMKELI